MNKNFHLTYTGGNLFQSESFLTIQRFPTLIGIVKKSLVDVVTRTVAPKIKDFAKNI